MRSTGNIARDQRFQKVIWIITNISFWILLFIFVLMLIMGILSLLGKIQLSDNINNISISPDGVLRFRLSEFSQSQKQSVTTTVFFTVATFSFVYGALNYYLLGILRSVKKGSPFVKENASRLSIMGFILIGGSIIVGFIYSLMVYTIFEALKITNLSVNFQINSTMFASGLLLLILAGVFRYGSYLQEEYDATL